MAALAPSATWVWPWAGAGQDLLLEEADEISFYSKEWKLVSPDSQRKWEKQISFSFSSRRPKRGDTDILLLKAGGGEISLSLILKGERPAGGDEDLLIPEGGGQTSSSSIREGEKKRRWRRRDLLVLNPQGRKEKPSRSPRRRWRSESSFSSKEIGGGIFLKG